MNQQIQKSDIPSATITQFDTKRNHTHQQSPMHASFMNECIMHDENTQPGVFCFPSGEELQELCSLYEGCIGQPLNNASAAILEEWFERMELALIREAIMRTGIYARRPGAPYVRAILRNWDSQGIHSIDELSRSEGQRSKAAAHQSAMKPWWQKRNYLERPITPETYGSKSYSDPTVDFD